MQLSVILLNQEIMPHALVKDIQELRMEAVKKAVAIVGEVQETVITDNKDKEVKPK